MHLDLQKLARLRSCPLRPAGPGELRRLDQLFLVAPDLPVRPTLETIFESDCQKPVDLFWLTFRDGDTFLRAEDLVRQLKKNFRGFLLGRFETPPPAPFIDRAYAAGLDLFELRLEQLHGESLVTLNHALGVFPQWGTLATLPAHAAEEKQFDELAARGIVPLLELADTPAEAGEGRLANSYKQLQRAWRRHKVALKPLRPLLDLATPLTSPPRRRGVGALLERVDDVRLRTGSDLRRLLRVREVAASFESAGL